MSASFSSIGRKIVCIISVQPVRLLLCSFYLLTFGFKTEGQHLPDSLINNILQEHSDDPAHHEFHPDENPIDKQFLSYVPSVDQELIEDRASCLELDIPLVVNKSVCGFIHYFTVRKRNYTQTMLERKNYYFPIFEYYLRKHEMPDALKYLAIVESGLNYKAKSKAGALGLWQFMPGTGRDFRLGQSHHSDQRQNPWLATEAACKFLKNLYGTFQDWELALAAYNCGPGNVMKAQRRSGKRGFWEIYSFLPQETRSYVPQFYAVVYSMNFAREHNIVADVDSVLTTVPLDTFHITTTCDLRKLENLLGMEVKSLQHHNPELRSNFFPGGKLLVPGSHSALLSANLASFIDSAKYQAPVIAEPLKKEGFVYLRKGSSVQKISLKYGWDATAFCRINRISGGKITKSRQYRIPEKQENLSVLANADSSLRKENYLHKNPDNDNSPAGLVSEKAVFTVSQLESKGAIATSDFHQVQKGEGLYSIARKYGLDINTLRQLNPAAGNQLFSGQMIRLRNDVNALPDSSTKKGYPAGIAASASSLPAHAAVKKAGGGPIIYQVQKGDTLYSITRKFNRISIKELIRINNLKNKQIKPGQQLIVG